MHTCIPPTPGLIAAKNGDNAVQLDSTMGVLPDGTIYAAKSVLYAQAKDVTVTVENNGYRRNGG